MTTANYYKGIKSVLRLETDVKGCKHCKLKLNGFHIDTAINHYIEEHGYELLHIGSETKEDINDTKNITVALLGLRGK